jgi:hypothetical protein
VAPRAIRGLALALALIASPADAQVPGHASGSFHVTWEPRRVGVAPSIEGRVHNDSTARVTNVRLQVEGFAADDHLVGRRYAWAAGDVGPGGETYFVVESIPQAVSYRIGVVSYDVVSSFQAP